jgi:hypothetical protein
MKYDESRVYTALNADELKLGSEVIVADDMMELKHRVKTGSKIETLYEILDESSEYRFVTSSRWALAYLVSEPDEKKLKWIDLEIGDIISNEGMDCMIVSIDKSRGATYRVCVIASCGQHWLSDSDLEDWEKVSD